MSNFRLSRIKLIDVALICFLGYVSYFFFVKLIQGNVCNFIPFYVKLIHGKQKCMHAVLHALSKFKTVIALNH